MVRRTISLILVLAIAAIALVGTPQALFAGPNSGEVDPTGLDSTRRFRNVDPSAGTIAAANQDVVAGRVAVTRWIEAFYLKTLLRSLGL